MIEKQGDDECMLAVIAALAKKPLSLIRKQALELAQKESWGHVLFDRNLYWNVIDALVDNHDLYGLIPSKRDCTYRVPYAKAKVTSLPEKGVGSVLLINRNTGLPHVAYLKDGHIYDPQNNIPNLALSLDQFNGLRNGRFIIAKVFYRKD